MESSKGILRTRSADIITVTRIILSVVLLFLPPLSSVFFIIYALCGVSDMIDGTVARHFGCASRFGALLDSIADIAFVIASAVRLLPVLYPLFPAWWMYPVIAIVAVKLASLFAGFIKFRKLCFLHTYMNKLAGAVVFILPFFYRAEWFPVAVGIVCAVALVAAADEFVCILKMKEYRADTKSGNIFKKALDSTLAS